ncbi:MAG: hypothetical protein MJZ30_06240 [Paludibacteraceae bacterium]|nr:hypothetical protein [Paludibacteraceae bacterium]
MPDTPKGILELFREITDDVDENGDILPREAFVCYLEDVGHGRVGEGVGALCKFARHNGHLEMALIAEGIRTVHVLPQKWMKSLGIGKSSDCASKTEWKNKIKRRMEDLYPQFKVTLKNADALGILEFAIEQERER